MSIQQVFCSYCGNAQMVAVHSGAFCLHCPSCSAMTLGLGSGWSAAVGNENHQVPLPPLVSYQETELVCESCEAFLNVELALRSSQPPCRRCSSLVEISAAADVQSAAVSKLSDAEMAFLGGAN